VFLWASAACIAVTTLRLCYFRPIAFLPIAQIYLERKYHATISVFTKLLNEKYVVHLYGAVFVVREKEVSK